MTWSPASWRNFEARQQPTGLYSCHEALLLPFEQALVRRHETRLTDADLAHRYHSHCDPRLNPAQAMELADRAAEALAARIPILA